MCSYKIYFERGRQQSDRAAKYIQKTYIQKRKVNIERNNCIKFHAIMINDRDILALMSMVRG